MSEPPAVVHRRYVSRADVHYAGDLVNGAFALSCFGDVVTDLAITLDGDEGLLGAYSMVEFHAPLRAGDVVEFHATLTRQRTRTRTVDLICRVVSRSVPEAGDTAAVVLDAPLLAVTAQATYVVPAR
ncbi:hotdog domain-containing protein [Paractinoplanes hotanensis]|uniref:3-aminobutyryl-CoA ammonia-lyase n=1 Tax=Paractinoplanes hotanensis TaxID=2906497 RepID=A0ABT0YCD3_9ACTN|nr:hotdog domain-containing protein [Actinoplanes hotanensis]MCM4083132.1 3-aminobutyryl-CoA ammonia-lyase [Actinoplanes hotanensis]